MDAGDELLNLREHLAILVALVELQPRPSQANAVPFLEESLLRLGRIPMLRELFSLQCWEINFYG